MVEVDSVEVGLAEIGDAGFCGVVMVACPVVQVTVVMLDLVVMVALVAVLFSVYSLIRTLGNSSNHY